MVWPFKKAEKKQDDYILAGIKLNPDTPSGVYTCPRDCINVEIVKDDLLRYYNAWNCVEIGRTAVIEFTTCTAKIDGGKPTDWKYKSRVILLGDESLRDCLKRLWAEEETRRLKDDVVLNHPYEG